MDPWQNINGLAPDDIRSMQNMLLRRYVQEYVYPFSPHYRKLFERRKVSPNRILSVEDLARLPFTSKEDFLPAAEGEDVAQRVRSFVLQPDAETIRAAWPMSRLLKMKYQSLRHGEAFVQERLSREFRPIFMTFTTGTTTLPVSCLYSHYDLDNLKISGHRMLKLFEIGPEERIVNMFPYAPHLAIWQVIFAGFEAGVMILSTGGGKVMGTGGNISALQKIRPSVLLGVPSYVYHVLRVAEEQGAKLDFIKQVVLGASAVSQDYKNKISAMLAGMGAPDVRVLGTYGFTEARTAWAECPAAGNVSSGYHLYPDKEIIEIIDPETGEVKKDGEDGEIVYTALDARGSAVIRYRTGDYVEGGVTWEPCPYCRRTVPRLSSRIGRLSHKKDLQLSKVKGALVNFNIFEDIFAAIDGVEEWQIELCKKDNDPFEVDEMKVYISCKGGGGSPELARHVRQRILDITEVSPNDVRFLPLSEMVVNLELETANKAKRIIDNRPKG